MIEATRPKNRPESQTLNFHPKRGCASQRRTLLFIDRSSSKRQTINSVEILQPDCIPGGSVVVTISTIGRSVEWRYNSNADTAYSRRGQGLVRIESFLSVEIVVKITLSPLRMAANIAIWNVRDRDLKLATERRTRVGNRRTFARNVTLPTACRRFNGVEAASFSAVEGRGARYEGSWKSLYKPVISRPFEGEHTGDRRCIEIMTATLNHFCIRKASACVQSVPSSFSR